MSITANFQTELKDQYRRSDFDVKGTLDLFKENLNKAKTIKKNGSTIILIDDNKKIISVIVFQSDKASIINTDNISFTCTKAYQPKTYSKVNEMFAELVGIFRDIND